MVVCNLSCRRIFEMTDGPLRRYTVAEFFCGCGGLSRGFWRTGRFRVVAGNDIKPEAIRTIALNHGDDDISPAILTGDIRTMSFDAILAKLHSHNINRDELDCLIGGPRCQGFS